MVCICVCVAYVCLFSFFFFFQRRLQRCCLVLLRISCPALSLLPFSLANQGFLSLLCLFSFLFLFPTNNGSAPTLGEEIRLFFYFIFFLCSGWRKGFFFWGFWQFLPRPRVVVFSSVRCFPVVDAGATYYYLSSTRNYHSIIFVLHQILVL